jgi:hypothetical protein
MTHQSVDDDFAYTSMTLEIGNIIQGMAGRVIASNTTILSATASLDVPGVNPRRQPSDHVAACSTKSSVAPCLLLTWTWQVEACSHRPTRLTRPDAAVDLPQLHRPPAMTRRILSSSAMTSKVRRQTWVGDAARGRFFWGRPIRRVFSRRGPPGLPKVGRRGATRFLRGRSGTSARRGRSAVAALRGSLGCARSSVCPGGPRRPGATRLP